MPLSATTFEMDRLRADWALEATDMWSAARRATTFETGGVAWCVLSR